MKFGNIFVGKRLFVGCGKPEALGKGETEIRGSAYVEGPLQVGQDDSFDNVSATVMIGPEYNSDSETHPTNSLHVNGDVLIVGNTQQTGDITATGTITAATFVGDHTSGSITGGVSGKSAGAKAFDIKHPTKEGQRLRHICIEGPESAVYVRGRVNNRNNVITLPDYWDGLVDYDTMTVQLTPIHSHQNVIVKRIDVNERKIHLQAQGGMPVDCFYHIIAERKDIEKLIPEYEGKTSNDYPGDNSIYSINK